MSTIKLDGQAEDVLVSILGDYWNRLDELQYMGKPPREQDLSVERVNIAFILEQLSPTKLDNMQTRTKIRREHYGRG